MAVKPVVYGASQRPPRGDYARAAPDYTCAQNYAAYTDADHDTLHARRPLALGLSDDPPTELGRDRERALLGTGVTRMEPDIPGSRTKGKCRSLSAPTVSRSCRWRR